MSISLIGRKKERAELRDALASPDAELVAVLGRRRVGKTFLVTETYREELVFELTGIQNGSTKQQLVNFWDELRTREKDATAATTEIPQDWQTAFRLLRQHLEARPSNHKPVIFFDEMPWLAGHRSGFLEAFGYFWNSWASRQHILVVICGSAASWMIKKVVHDKGGLHNRITRMIQLQPFTLRETEQYLHYRGVMLERREILHLYMALGGIPHYLRLVKPGHSTEQTIDRLCFAEGAPLRNEFGMLYAALFTGADRHKAVVETLGGKWKGLSREEIEAKIPQLTGGNLSAVLEELEQSGFITSYFFYGRKLKGKIFRLTDPFSLFYLRFIQPNPDQSDGAWMQMAQSQAYHTWSGYAFENICLRHLKEIKKALGIGGVHTQASSFYKKASGDDLSGAEIDLVLERRDRVINLFEMKFYEEAFLPTKSFAENLRQKMRVFREATHTNKRLSWILIAPQGIQHNQHSLGLVDFALDTNALFEDA